METKYVDSTNCNNLCSLITKYWTLNENLEKRAIHYEQMAKSYLKSYKLNEENNSHPAGYPDAIIPDEHGREQYLSAKLKAESLLSQVELLDTIISDLENLKLNMVTVVDISDCTIPLNKELIEDDVEKE